MKNPWLKKNPLLSMWLSGANSFLGAARGHASAQAKRNSTAAMKNGVRQMMNFWGGSPTASTRRSRKRNSR